MSAVESIVARLEGVQRSGKGWRARCPACSGRSGKVTITEGDDGRALLHCFGGCSALEVVQAIGFALADLFPERLRDDSPESRRKMIRAAREAGWGAALDMLDSEATVIFFAARDLRAGVPLDPSVSERLTQAVSRISDARAVLRDQPVYRPARVMQ